MVLVSIFGILDIIGGLIYIISIAEYNLGFAYTLIGVLPMLEGIALISVYTNITTNRNNIDNIQNSFNLLNKKIKYLNAKINSLEKVNNLKKVEVIDIQNQINNAEDPMDIIEEQINIKEVTVQKTDRIKINGEKDIKLEGFLLTIQSAQISLKYVKIDELSYSNSTILLDIIGKKYLIEFNDVDKASVLYNKLKSIKFNFEE